MVLLKWVLYNVSHVIMRILLRVMSPILNLLLPITLLFVVLTWTTIQYPIKITFILDIWAKNCLVPSIDP